MRFSLVMIALVLSIAVATWAAEPFRPTPQEGILLLANGQILRGKITHSGDYYYVALATGEIRLRTADVEMFCQTLEEGYERKRAALTAADINEHLHLAEWCIVQKLFGHAARELASAMAIEPEHPKIPVLERRLQLAMTDGDAMTERDGASSAARLERVSLSNDDLDRMVRGMPSGTVEAFTHTIQPLLLNNCTAAGCHGPGSATHFTLLRIPLGRLPSRRLTQRNLYATLEQTNRSSPIASPLLTMAIEAHGGARLPVFKTADMIAYRQLAAWVLRATHGNAPIEPVAQRPASVARVAEPLYQSPASGTSPSPNVKAQVPPAATSSSDAPSDVDPFDPEVFNRQSGPSP